MRRKSTCWPGAQGLGAGPAAEMLERRREPRLSWELYIQCPASGLGVMVAGLQEVNESGGIQGPGACGPGLQGAWGPGLGPAFRNHPASGLGVMVAACRKACGPGLQGAWGPGPQGLGPGPGNHPTRPPRSADPKP